MWYSELPGASIREPSASSLSRQAVPRRRLEILEEAQVGADYALATELEDAIGRVGRRRSQRRMVTSCMKGMSRCAR